jgi:hypothetical protein
MEQLVQESIYRHEQEQQANALLILSKGADASPPQSTSKYAESVSNLNGTTLQNILIAEKKKLGKTKQNKPRQKVTQACTACKKAHLSCDNGKEYTQFTYIGNSVH